MMKMYNSVRHLIMELNELLIVYGYMIQNAPTEEARRLSELNRRTVKATKELFGNMFNDTFNENLAAMSEVAEEVPVFAEFRAAAQYAFIEESQIIQMLKNIYLNADKCHHDTIFGQLIEHIVNAMRLLYLLT
ncbi:MAG TPA: hypothetical protein PLJ33_01315 [Peptococcaceae bacterium]|jgi:hypothetical protein|nr:hypothetical protein [Clostridia bacterium]HOB81426.1 hypothetical protein [Peptococcaceae bacterium]HPZ71058.1 hypothetical protein [Peptococcaceae bacterium]HQD53477.1 hypothetical protein [Peptococcaceae bacterium]